PFRFSHRPIEVMFGAMKESPANLDDITNAAQNFALSVFGLLPARADDPVPEVTRTIVLLGPHEPGFWAHVCHAPEFGDGKTDPLDRWSTRIIRAMAADLGGTAILPFSLASTSNSVIIEVCKSLAVIFNFPSFTMNTSFRVLEFKLHDCASFSNLSSVFFISPDSFFGTGTLESSFGKEISSEKLSINDFKIILYDSNLYGSTSFLTES
ncbi:MAG: hypothetical protein IIC67_10790, partial [Thaumarchaeota archaeon]|nr:hypothetical protein [Nitrososphaerota archaeon]